MGTCIMLPTLIAQLIAIALSDAVCVSMVVIALLVTL